MRKVRSLQSVVKAARRKPGDRLFSVRRSTWRLLFFVRSVLIRVDPC